MKELLETFRRHSNTTSLIRGELPKVEFEARLLLKGIIVFIASLLAPFLILKDVFGFGSGALIFCYLFAIVCTALLTRALICYPIKTPNRRQTETRYFKAIRLLLCLARKIPLSLRVN